MNWAHSIHRTASFLLPPGRNAGSDAGLKLAVGSASRNAPFVLGRLGLDSAFDYVVDAGRIRRGKPAPETFTNAADYLKVPYAFCIGVEDAAAGVEAIKRAGMFAVGIGSAQTLRQAD